MFCSDNSKHKLHNVKKISLGKVLVDNSLIHHAAIGTRPRVTY